MVDRGSTGLLQTASSDHGKCRRIPAMRRWTEPAVGAGRVCARPLEVAELGGFEAAALLLDSWGLDWLPGKAAPTWSSRLAGPARLDAERVRGLQCVAVEAWNRHQLRIPLVLRHRVRARRHRCGTPFRRVAGLHVTRWRV